MKLIKQEVLFNTEGNSNKTYEVDLCEVNDLFIVNFRYGKIGTNLREGTKTVMPVSREAAEDIFEKLVTSKVKKGYVSGDSEAIEEDLPLEISQEGLLKAIEKHLKSYTAGKETNWSLSRILWKIGFLELKQFLPLISLLEDRLENEMEHYSYLFAIVRCKEVNAKQKVLAYYNQDKERYQIMYDAVTLTDANINTAHFESLPKVIKLNDKLEAPNALVEVLQGISFEEGFYFLYRYYCYLLGTGSQKEDFLEYLGTIPLKPKYFKAIRKIFKLAELVNDFETLGVIAYLFDKNRAFFSIPMWSEYHYFYEDYQYESVNIYKELKQPTSRLAYSNKTRGYFLKRVQRNLKTYGEQCPEYFIQWATAFLLQFKDKDSSSEEEYYHYDWKQGGYYTTKYKRNASLRNYNYLLYSNSDRYELGYTKWFIKDLNKLESNKREEVFSSVWSIYPDALFKLLTKAKDIEVAEFALKAIQSNTEYLEALGIEELKALIKSSYQKIARLGLDLVKKELEKGENAAELITVLMTSVNSEARLYAVSYIEENKELLKNRLVLSALILNKEEEFTTLRENIWSFAIPPEVIEEVVALILNTLLRTKTSEDEDVEQIVSFIEGYNEKLDFSNELILQFLQDSAIKYKELGAVLLKKSEKSLSDFPSEMISSLIASDNKEFLNISLKLLESSSSEELNSYQNIIFQTVPHADESLLKVLDRIFTKHQANSTFGKEAIVQLLPVLRRHVDEDAVHKFIVEKISNEYSKYLNSFDQKQLFRYVTSTHLSAQDFSWYYIQNWANKDLFKVSHYVKCASSDILALREFAWVYFMNNPDQIKENKKEALKILDASWEDSRKFGFEYFKNNWSIEDWTAPLLVSVIDSVRTDVQVFGRTLIGMFFKEDYGVDFLLKLSQHPDTNVQLLASNYLEQFASGKVEVIEKLVSYFTTVLFKVNKAKVLKERVLLFLEKEALISEEVAKIAIPILQRVIASLSYNTSSTALVVLLKIQSVHNDLNELVETIDYETR